MSTSPSEEVTGEKPDQEMEKTTTKEPLIVESEKRMTNADFRKLL